MKDPEGKENYKGVRRAPVRLPLRDPVCRTELRFACTRTKIEAPTSRSTAGSLQNLEKPQEPPPQTSCRDGFESLKGYRRAHRRGKRKSKLQQLDITRAEGGVASSHRSQQPTRDSAAGNSNPEREAHGGAQQIPPQHKEKDHEEDQ